MPRLIFAAGAVRGLERCRPFLLERNPLAARRAAEAIQRQLLALESQPEMGRPWSDFPELRELPIPFGDSGYVGLYRLDRTNDRIVVLAFRHQREAGY